MSKFSEKWDEANRKFVLPQGTDNVKKLTKVVENLVIEKLPEIIDQEIVQPFVEMRKDLDMILKALDLKK